MNKELIDIEIISNRLRKDIINGSCEFEGSDKFPLGCCGNASEILKSILLNKGYKDIIYLKGWHNNKSHGWLEYKGYIIDITIDQFVEFKNSNTIIIKKEDSKFHSNFII